MTASSFAVSCWTCAEFLDAIGKMVASWNVPADKQIAVDTRCPLCGHPWRVATQMAPAPPPLAKPAPDPTS